MVGSGQTLIGGLYECSDCGHVVEITNETHLRKYGVRSSDSKTALFRCPSCCQGLSLELNTFNRLGFRRTLSYVAHKLREDIIHG